MPGCDGAGTAERSYPVSEVRGGGREELSCVRGRGSGPEELLSVQSRGSRQEPPTPEARAGGREEQPGERWLSRRRRA